WAQQGQAWAQAPPASRIRSSALLPWAVHSAASRPWRPWFYSRASCARAFRRCRRRRGYCRTSGYSSLSGERPRRAGEAAGTLDSVTGAAGKRPLRAPVQRLAVGRSGTGPNETSIAGGAAASIADQWRCRAVQLRPVQVGRPVMNASEGLVDHLCELGLAHRADLGFLDLAVLEQEQHRD